VLKVCLYNRRRTAFVIDLAGLGDGKHW